MRPGLAGGWAVLEHACSRGTVEQKQSVEMATGTRDGRRGAKNLGLHNRVTWASPNANPAAALALYPPRRRRCSAARARRVSSSPIWDASRWCASPLCNTGGATPACFPWMRRLRRAAAREWQPHPGRRPEPRPRSVDTDTHASPHLRPPPFPVSTLRFALASRRPRPPSIVSDIPCFRRHAIYVATHGPRHVAVISPSALATPAYCGTGRASMAAASGYNDGACVQVEAALPSVPPRAHSGGRL